MPSPSSAPRLPQIVLRFPNGAAASRDFFAGFRALLGRVPAAEMQPDAIVLMPSQPVDARPGTRLEAADVDRPEIVFASPTMPNLDLVGLRIGNGTNDAPRISAKAVSGTWPADGPRAHLTLPQLAERLNGAVTRMDHAGVNVPATMVDKRQWEDLMQRVAGIAALYRYPEEEWPFIIPATDAELADDIRTFVPGREPKFEWVYDTWAPVPVIQFSLGTNLSRAELEARLPSPEGWGIPGLDHIFRSAFVMSPWPNLMLRFDFNYGGAPGAPVSDWDTGEWLVTQGGRMRA